MPVALFDRSAKLRGARPVRSARGFFRDCRGGVAVFAGFAFPVLVGFGGVAIVSSNIRSSQGNLQNVLDAAVLGGAKDPNGVDSQIATAQKYFGANLKASGNANAGGASAQFSVSDAILNGSATSAVQNPFGGLLGLPAEIPTRVVSSATASRSKLCVLGLNSFDSGAFDLNGNAQFRAPDCAVQANSGSTQGMTQEGNPVAVAQYFGVAGGHTGGNYAPVPTDGAPKIADPYASVPFPPYDFCADTRHPAQIQTDTTLSPGTYCGGVHIFSQAKVTLRPGIYVMNGGPFWADGGGAVTGDQVMLAFTGDGATVQMQGNVTMTVTSPVSGTYANMQFMQDRTQAISHLGTWFSVGGASGDTSKLKYDGVAYLPTQNWWIFGNAAVEANSPSLAIVAGKIWTQGNATVNITTNNPRKLSVASQPNVVTNVRLVR